MLQIKDLNKFFLERTLFKDASLFVNEGERIAVVGANGSGKTTLFKMIIGREFCDSGEIILKKDTRTGFLAQEIDALKGFILLDTVMCCSPEIEVLHRRLEELAVKLSETDRGLHKQHLHDYGQAQSRFEHLGGYTLEQEAKIILIGLGFKETDFSRKTDEFSGGWMMRIALAKLLLNPPELMILDEPTNHLDLESLLWLQNYLVSYKGTLIFTAHDRDFISQVSTRIVDIDEGRLVSYNGSYEYYLEQKLKRQEALIAARKNQERKVEQVQRFIDRFRASAARANSVQSKIKLLAKMEVIEAPKETKKVRFNFPQPPDSSYEVITLKDVHKSYGHNRIYQGIDLAICRGDKIALVGPNGAGKSTLLKILAGVLDINSGSRIMGRKVNLGYYPQHRLDMLNPRNTCLNEMEEVYPSGRQTDMRKLLGRFLFSGDDVYKEVSVLSGGEKSRLILAKILANPPNFLLMDEPINHLDISSREILIDALRDFTGTLCFISHDVYFIKKAANKIIEIKQGNLGIYPGDYDYYTYKKGLNADTANQTIPAPSGEEKTKYRRNNKPSDLKRDLRQKEKEKNALNKKMSDTEKELDELSSRLEELNKALADPATYKSSSFVDLIKEHKLLQSKIEELTFQWERYAERLSSYEEQ